MAKEIKKADAGRYTSADHVEFHEMMYEILDRYKAVENGEWRMEDCCALSFAKNGEGRPTEHPLPCTGYRLKHVKQTPAHKDIEQ